MSWAVLASLKREHVARVKSDKKGGKLVGGTCCWASVWPASERTALGSWRFLTHHPAGAGAKLELFGSTTCSAASLSSRAALPGYLGHYQSGTSAPLEPRDSPRVL